MLSMSFGVTAYFRTTQCPLQLLIYEIIGIICRLAKKAAITVHTVCYLTFYTGHEE